MPRIKNKNYSSKKHPILEYIFKKYYKPVLNQKIIPFYLSDIADGYRACKLREPVSISNTILDLTRQDRGIKSRLPKSIYKLGYDLRKKTGQDSQGKKFAGEFVFVSLGKALNSWLIWPKKVKEITISSKRIPDIVTMLVRRDEGALFSVIDYTDTFSQVLMDGKEKVYRIQNPMKWQPNEIDGFYGTQLNGKPTLYPVEAKALTTGDDINLDQMRGGFFTVKEQMTRLGLEANIQPIALRMIKNGIDIAIFPMNEPPQIVSKFIRVKYSPKLSNWQ